MKKIIAGILVLILFYSYFHYNSIKKRANNPEKTQTEAELQEKDKLLKMKMKDLVNHFKKLEKDRDPTIKQFYSNGKIQAVTYADGELSHYKEYYMNGVLKSEWFYIDGEPHGIGRKYYENAQLYSEVEFRNGILEGKAILYQPDGQKVIEQVYENNRLTREEWGTAANSELLKQWDKY
jgi:antitoxin component YwqK of YwqJK toxin-antitoxin module